MSDINLIKLLKSKLDFLEEDAAFESALREAGIFEEVESLFEASPLLKKFGTDPEGLRLARYLHNVLHISDRATMIFYRHKDHPKNTNLEAYDFKLHYDNFIVFHGPNGWAAVRPKQEWLEPKLAALRPDQSFNPRAQSRHDLQPYIMYASVKNHDDIIIHEFQATRLGRYGALEKKDPKTGERLINVADEMKKYVGFGKPDEMLVYRLEVREDPSLGDLPDAQFSGRRSRTLGAAGPSVQRFKVKARSKNRDAGVESTESRLVDRTLRFAPVVMREVQSKLVNSRADGETTSKYDEYEGKLGSDEFKTVWTNMLQEILGSEEFITQFQKNLEIYRNYLPKDKSSDSDLILKLYESPPFWVLVDEGKMITPEQVKQLIFDDKLDSKYHTLAFRNDSVASDVANDLNEKWNKVHNPTNDKKILPPYTVEKFSLPEGKVIMSIMKLVKEKMYEAVQD